MSAEIESRPPFVRTLSAEEYAERYRNYERRQVIASKRFATALKRRGRRIRRLERVVELAAQKRSVFHRVQGVMPAAFVASMQLSWVHRMIAGDYLYEYRSPDKAVAAAKKVRDRIDAMIVKTLTGGAR